MPGLKAVLQNWFVFARIAPQQQPAKSGCIRLFDAQADCDGIGNAPGMGGAVLAKVICGRPGGSGRPGAADKMGGISNRLDPLLPDGNAVHEFMSSSKFSSSASKVAGSIAAAAVAASRYSQAALAASRL